MNGDIEQAITEIEPDVRDTVERVWSQVTDGDIPEYRILIWGSTIQEKERTPNDLDLVFEYSGTQLEPSEEKSIEGWVQNSVGIDGFPELDLLVRHHTVFKDIVKDSRVCRTYSVDEDGWVEHY